MSTLKTIKLQNPSGTSSNIDLGTGGEVLIGSASTTGTASQTLQVTGGAYVSGSIGIGTTNPGQTLDIYGTTRITQTSNGQNGLNVEMPLGVENTASGIRVRGYSPAIELVDKDGVQNWYMAIDDNVTNNFQIARGYGPGQNIPGAIEITPYDNIGIGTTNPQTKLDVLGQGQFNTNGATLNLVGTDHTYIQWYPDGIAAGRKAYTGYPGASVDNFAIFNQIAGGGLSFGVVSSERAVITSGGYFKASNTGSYWNSSGTYHESINDVSNQPAHLFFANNASYASNVLFTTCSRAANSAYAFIIGYSNTTSDIEFYIRGDGQAYADGSWNGGGADYAEMFEWADGNINNEDRVGYTVSLVGNKIKIAEEGEDIIGVISGNPSVVGDTSWNKWTEKYLKDSFNRYIVEEHNVVEWTDEDGKEHSYEDWNLPEDIIVPADATIKTHDDKGNRFTHRKLNPEYNPDQEYITREDRQEWDAVGLVGKLRVRKGQVIGNRWIKMQDIDENVEEWLVR